MHKRAAAALTATTGGLVLVLSFHTPDRAGNAASGGSTTSRSTPATTGRSSTGGPAPATTPTTAPAAGGSYRDGTFTGDAVSYRWGTVQVQVVVANGRVTDVVALQQPDDDRRSQQINGRAIPALKREVLSAQDADIDMVSGATDTSENYIESLQAALDQAGGA
jgi:uncharacterized protein with FMN-binding domain